MPVPLSRTRTRIITVMIIASASNGPMTIPATAPSDMLPSPSPSLLLPEVASAVGEAVVGEAVGAEVVGFMGVVGTTVGLAV